VFGQDYGLLEFPQFPGSLYVSLEGGNPWSPTKPATYEGLPGIAREEIEAFNQYFQ